MKNLNKFLRLGDNAADPFNSGDASLCIVNYFKLKVPMFEWLKEQFKYFGKLTPDVAKALPFPDRWRRHPQRKEIFRDLTFCLRTINYEYTDFDGFLKGLEGNLEKYENLDPDLHKDISANLSSKIGSEKEYASFLRTDSFPYYIVVRASIYIKEKNPSIRQIEKLLSHLLTLEKVCKVSFSWSQDIKNTAKMLDQKRKNPSEIIVILLR